MSTEASFDSMISAGSATIEEGMITGRSYMKTGITEELEGAPVNGPSGDKGQYLWDGTYTVTLDRGVGITGVYHITSMGGQGAQNQRCLSINERVTIMWLSREDVQIPVVIENCTIDFYKKQLESRGHLLDFGEQIIRGAQAASPGGTVEAPFDNNQYEQAVNSTDGNLDNAKTVQYPGSEMFFDKFGRLITLSRTSDYETLVTNGKVDSGQDDVSTLLTISEQDDYYAKILNDESEPVNGKEPFAPKALNLSQYIQRSETFKVINEDDPDRTATRGILPRFDKWKFLPTVIRKYEKDTIDNTKVGETFSTRQVRQQSVVTSATTSYGYVHTITQQGDIKEFVPRHINQRIVGDKLVSQGGNNEFRLQTTSRLANGDDNNINHVHREYLEDGTVRLRVSEDFTASTATSTATYDKQIFPDGTTELYIKENGGSSTDFNLKVKLSPTGEIEIESVDSASIKLTGDFTLDSENNNITGTTTIDGGTTITGGSLTVDGSATPTGTGGFCGLTNCLFTGAPHTSNKIVGT